MNKNGMNKTRKAQSIHSSKTRGAILVWFILVLPLLLGMTGLVIDTGLLMANYRHVQNSVDAAALAGADALADGKSTGQAMELANAFITQHHELASADVEVLIPPLSGPYTGDESHVEVIATSETATLFIHLIPGAARARVAKARAVAGSEIVKTIDTVVALDPDARPGIAAVGNASLSVEGRIVVNSEGGGVDAEGNPVAGTGTAAFVSPFGLVRAGEVHVVGGTNRPDRIENYTPGGPHPLKTGQLPSPDPLGRLPTPTVLNGVNPIRRGAPVATESAMELNNSADDSIAPNEVIDVNGVETMVLRPGIYSSIQIDGGNVRFEPGIYVLAASPTTANSLQILGGNVEAEGIMFYNTTDEYDPATGYPDLSDGDQRPTQSNTYGQILLLADIGFKGIDTSKYNYSNAPAAISAFDGMLIYQRRHHATPIQFLGHVADGDLVGAVYAKWAPFLMTADGVFHSQFVVGSLRIPGHGNLTIKYNAKEAVGAMGIFLVE